MLRIVLVFLLRLLVPHLLRSIGVPPYQFQKSEYHSAFVVAHLKRNNDMK